MMLFMMSVFAGIFVTTSWLVPRLVDGDQRSFLLGMSGLLVLHGAGALALDASMTSRCLAAALQTALVGSLAVLAAHWQRGKQDAER